MVNYSDLGLLFRRCRVAPDLTIMIICDCGLKPINTPFAGVTYKHRLRTKTYAYFG